MRDTGLLGFDKLIALPTFGEPGTDIGSTWCLDPPTGGEAGREYGENARLCAAAAYGSATSDP
jgi:hypothetical protein